MGSSKVREHYQTVNGCKRQIECQQIFWVFGVLLILGVFSGMVAPPIAQDGNLIMIIFMIIAYSLCPIIIYDYCKLSCTDPVDPNILSEQSYQFEQSKLCTLCQLYVKKQTEHCLNCQRCTDRMDHHSQLVNNCISLNNYSNYVRMNVCFCLMTAIMGLEAVFFFLKVINDPAIEAMVFNKWALAVIGLLNLLVCLFSTVEVMFSCYLRYNNMTRLGYRFRQTDSNNSDFSDSDNISPIQTPN